MMQGRVVRRITNGLILGLALLLAGCGESLPSHTPPPGPRADASTRFDPATAGSVHGRVLWTGAIPRIDRYRAPISPLSEQSGGQPMTWANPHAPKVDGVSRGVAGAIIFLRGIDPRRARPWDHPAVFVELRDFQVRVLQGDRAQDTAFVRCGEEVEFRSAQPVLDTLTVRGDAFFSLPFPPGGRPCSRRLSRCGLVELSSGTGHFWMRGYLFVDDHPYYTRSDAEGRFRLPQVPPGEYELVCRHPNWLEEAHELDADTGLVVRVTFRSPVVISRPVRVDPSATADATFTLSASLFGR
jgi:hypothetical protein